MLDLAAANPSDLPNDHVFLRLDAHDYQSMDARDLCALRNHDRPATLVGDASGFAAGYDDLGDSSVYATCSLTSAEQRQVVDIARNAAGGVAMSDAVGDVFAIAGAVATLDRVPRPWAL